MKHLYHPPVLSADQLDQALPSARHPEGFAWLDEYQRQMLKGAVPRVILDKARELKIVCCGVLHEDEGTMAADCPWASTNMACGHFYEGQSDVAVSKRIAQLAEVAHLFGLSTEELLAHRFEIDKLSADSQFLDIEHAQKGYGVLHLQGPNERAPGHAALKKSLVLLQKSLGGSVQTIRDRLLRFLDGILEPETARRVALPLA